MPNVDVTDALLDPDLVDLVTVRRRVETVGDDGIGRTADSDTPNVPAYVMPMEASTDRREDGVVEPITYTVVTSFRLRVASQGVKADMLRVDGNWLTVTKVLPLSRFGSGFCEAEAVVMAPAYSPVG